jgi:hypothetical protein
MRTAVTGASETSGLPVARRLRRSASILAAAVAAVLLVAVGGRPAFALDEPTVPEPVAAYFASGLVPRLTDLYGPGTKPDSGIDFGASTKVGDIHRVFVWTADFLARKKTDSPTELTNDWVAPVSVKGQVAGLATVWINPTSDDPELADFNLGPGLVSALAAAPKGTVLIRDDAHSAWFATDGTSLTPLVSGTSGVATTTTIAAYQKTFPAVTPSAPVSTATTNGGLALAATVLGVVVLLLAAFVLLPDRFRRRRKGTSPARVAADPEIAQEPEPLPQPAGPRKKSAAAKPAAAASAGPKSAAAKQAAAKPTAVQQATAKPADPQQSAAKKPAASRKPRTPNPPA